MFLCTECLHKIAVGIKSVTIRAADFTIDGHLQSRFQRKESGLKAVLAPRPVQSL